jgi:hypothetical protein
MRSVTPQGPESELGEGGDETGLEPADDVDRAAFAHAHHEVADKLPGPVVGREAAAVDLDSLYPRPRRRQIGRCGPRSVRDHRRMAQQEQPVLCQPLLAFVHPPGHLFDGVFVRHLAQVDALQHDVPSDPVRSEAGWPVRRNR